MQLCSSSFYSTVLFLPFVNSHHFLLFCAIKAKCQLDDRMICQYWADIFSVLWDFYAFTWFADVLFMNVLPAYCYFVQQ